MEARFLYDAQGDKLYTPEKPDGVRYYHLCACAVDVSEIMPEKKHTNEEFDCQESPSKRAKLDSVSAPERQPQTANVVWSIDDPSEFRPEYKTGELTDVGKERGQFRAFYEESGERYDTVKRTYTLMHTLQTVKSVKARLDKWCKLDRAKMVMMDAIFELDKIIDESDPDTAEPNSFHLFQTAERVREAHPDKEWLQLTALIHDVGKLVAVWGEPQWAAVGDTFPVGCEFSKECVFHELFKGNPDSSDPRYNTKYGMYEPNCGLNNVMMSFGHDEYMYRVLVGNGCKLPEQALYIIRYHSFYPWHTGGAYDHLCTEKDREMLKWIREFNKFDLYSKADVKPDMQKLKPYYQKLIDEFCPGELQW